MNNNIRKISITDRQFVTFISQEYKVTKSVLTDLVVHLRNWIILTDGKKNKNSYNWSHHDKSLLRITKSPIKAIHLETESKDLIHILDGDLTFEWFRPVIKKIKNNYHKEINTKEKSWTKLAKSLGERVIFKTISQVDIQVFAQRAVIGWFLFHFGIHGRKPIMSPEEWEDNMIGDSHDDYLNFRVKYRHDKYIQELQQQK
jgi:hypothetical protein